MTDNTSRRRRGFFEGLSGLGWPVFIIDEILEHGPKIVDGIKQSKWDDAAVGIFLILLALAFSPLLIFFALPAWLVGFKLGFGLAAGLKAGLFGWALLAFWIAKRALYNPNQRALTQARLEHQHDSSLSPGELAERVRKALAEDERASKRADDVVRSLLLREQREKEPRRGISLFGIYIRFKNPLAGWLDFDGRIKSFSGPKLSTHTQFGQGRGKLPGVINKNDLTRRR